ncbi:hypothetical protein PTKIN_Ptkin05aG0065800 [Pterospermum kingtungense]
MDEARAQPVCAQEALDLLNCVTQSPFDEEKCTRLLHSLRECVHSKKVKKFSLDNQEHPPQDTDSAQRLFHLSRCHLDKFVLYDDIVRLLSGLELPCAGSHPMNHSA